MVLVILAPNTSVGHWQEAGSASAFFNTSFCLYGRAPWDFTNTWLATGVMYPDLLFFYDVWSGSGNWSDAANWSKDIVPTAMSKVLFNATSLNDSTIDAFGGNIGSLVITSGYTGNIAQNNDLTLSGNYIQNGSTFNQNANLSINGDFFQTGGAFISDTTKTFTVGNSFSLSGGTFNRFTGLGTGLDPYLIYDVYGLQAMEDYLSSTILDLPITLMQQGQRTGTQAQDLLPLEQLDTIHRHLQRQQLHDIKFIHRSSNNEWCRSFWVYIRGYYRKCRTGQC